MHTKLLRLTSTGILNDFLRQDSQNELKKRKGWNFAIITTDGYIPTITVKAKIPTMILITERGKVNFNSNYKYKTVKMN